MQIYVSLLIKARVKKRELKGVTISNIKNHQISEHDDFI